MIDKILTVVIGLQVFIQASIVTDRWVPVFRLGGISIGTTDLLIIFSLLLIFLKFLSDPSKFKQKFSLTSLVMIIFLFIGVIGLVSGVFSKEIGINLAIRDSRPFFLYLIYFSTLSLNASKKNISRLFNMIMIIALISAVLSILQVAVGDRLSFVAGKVGNLKISGNEYTGITRVGGAASSIISYSLILILFKIFGKATIRRLCVLFTIWMGFLVLFARGVTVSLAMSMCIIAPFTDSAMKKKILAGMCLVTFLGIILIGAGSMGLLGAKVNAYLGATVDRFSTLQPSKITQDKSFMSRFDEAQRVLPKIKNKPFMGHGFGAVAQKVWWSGRMQETSFVHNGYINILFRLGLVGLITYLFLILSFCLAAIKRIRHFEDIDLKLIHTASTVFIISILPACIVQPANMIANWIIIVSIAMALSQLCYLADQQGNNESGNRSVSPMGHTKMIFRKATTEQPSS